MVSARQIKEEDMSNKLEKIIGGVIWVAFWMTAAIMLLSRL